MKGVKYMFELGSNLGAGWKPRVFGDWYRDEIEKLLAGESKGNEK